MKYYCIDCGEEITVNSGFYGLGRCRSCSKLGKRHPNYGKHHTKKWKHEHSKRMSGKNHPMFGKHQSEEHKRKTSKKLKGKKFSKTHCKNISKALKGKKKSPFSKEHKRKIGKALKEYKHTKETKRKMSLAGGGTGIPYENNRYPEEFYKIKPKIRKRDNYTCQECDKKFDKYSTGLDIHHIDYNKQNNKESNLICLCHACNIKVNYNRNQWKQIFQEKINDIYQLCN